MLLALLPSWKQRARAATLDFDGTLEVALPAGTPVRFAGPGVAGVNGAGALGHLDDLALPGGVLSGTATVTANTTTAPPTLQSLWVSATLPAGGFASLSGAPPLASGQLPVHGQLKLCIILPGCSQALAIPMTENGTRGVGLGGTLTVSGFAKDLTHISLTAAPWTLGTAQVTFTTASGANTTTTRTGFAHAPASGTSSTAMPGGAIQFVSPMHIATSNASLASLPGFATLRVRFVPEPGRLTLLASGVAGLAALARRRHRRRHAASRRRA